jgi:hypothetical protein
MVCWITLGAFINRSNTRGRRFILKKTEIEPMLRWIIVLGLYKPF